MTPEPSIKRAVAYFDGQNLFHGVKDAFGYTYPNFDPLKLAQTLCVAQGWTLKETHFYTGIPSNLDNPFWNAFWGNKLRSMARQGVQVFSRPLRYRNKTVTLNDGGQVTFMAAEEKGIDVRISLDVIRGAYHGLFDVALVFSQDQDLSEVADEIRQIAHEQNRWIKAASAFPLSPTSKNTRGINKTDWIRIDRATYDACIDPYDHRPPKPAKP